MSDRHWPATRKQLVYIAALEDQLGETPSEKAHMTVSDASKRIGYLLKLKDAKALVDGVEIPVDIRGYK